MEGVNRGCEWRVWMEGVDGGSDWRVWMVRKYEIIQLVILIVIYHSQTTIQITPAGQFTQPVNLPSRLDSLTKAAPHTSHLTG